MGIDTFKTTLVVAIKSLNDEYESIVDNEDDYGDYYDDALDDVEKRIAEAKDELRKYLSKKKKAQSGAGRPVLHATNACLVAVILGMALVATA